MTTTSKDLSMKTEAPHSQASAAKSAQKYSDEEIREWARMASRRAGSFLTCFSDAVLRADPNNFDLLRPVAEQLIDKYPKYLVWAKEQEAERAQ